MDNLYKQITERRSIRKYKNFKMPKEDENKILNAIYHCPTSINGQQFTAILIKDKNKRKQIAEMVGEQPWIEECSMFIIFCMDYNRANKALEKINEKIVITDSIESIMVGSIDATLAFSNAMIMAENLGYGTVPIGALRKDTDFICKLLELPKFTFPVLGLCIGLPDQKPDIKPRFPLNVLVHEDKYNIENLEKVIDDYDDIIKKYTDTRINSQGIHSWTDRIKFLYTRVYNEKERESLKKQGFKNTK